MRLPYVLLTLVYCAVIWWLSSRSDVPALPYEIPSSDKFGHILLYAGLAGVVYTGLIRSKIYTVPQVLLFGPILFVAFYGVIDELHQAFVPLRSCSAADWLADIVGAAIFQVVATPFRRRATCS